MSLAEEYARQFAWRAWPEILGALPPLRGSTVLDLGCGVGDLAAELVGRGARVVGFDLDDGLLEAWRRRFERMGLLRHHRGAAFEATRDAYLGCLSRDDHRSRASVRCCIARAPSS